MDDFNKGKDKDILERLSGNNKPKKVEESKKAGPGAQKNLSAESLKPKAPATPSTKQSNAAGTSILKTSPNEATGSMAGITKQDGTTYRPGSKNAPNVKLGSNKDAGLLQLKSEIPKMAGDNKLKYEQAKGNQKQPVKTPFKASSDPSLALKDKIALGLRYRIPKKLASLENDSLHKLSNYINEQINKNKANRDELINRIYAFRESWRNFEKAGLNIDIDGQHNEHIPLIFEKGKALHARIYQAIMGVEPPFVMLPRKAIAEKMKSSKEDLLRWVITDYINKGEGIAPETDKDIWNFVLDGTAIIKHSWERDVRKFVDVKIEEKLPLELDENGQLIMNETEVEKESVVYDGPTMKIVPLEDLYIVGPRAEGIDDADMVVHRQYYTKSDLIKLTQLGFFKQDAVEKVLNYKPVNYAKVTGFDTMLAQQEQRLSGLGQDDSGIPVYTIHESYLRYDIDKDGIDEEIVVWREELSGTIIRITYLDRVSPTGKRPFVLKKLIPMSGTPYGLGFGEILFGLNNLIDYIANQRLDAGTFQTFPWFVFRAGSGLQDNDIRIGPGKGIPVDNINDIAFPRTNGTTSYGFQEEGLLNQYAERLSVPAVAQGLTGGQGIARTATGAASLISELNTNLDIYIRRYQFGFKKSLGIIDKQCQELLPLGLEYRVLGLTEKGQAYGRFTDREAIKFDSDYELVGNSINSNPAIERDVATQLMQYILNPIILQSGIAGPKQVYNTMKNMLQKMDIRDINAYIQDPEQGMGAKFTAQDEINAIAAGVELPVQMNDEHEKKLAYYQAFEESPEFGFLTEDHIPLYAKMKRAHEQYAAALAAQAPLAANSGGMINPNLAAQIAASSGAPQGVPQQASDLAPASSPLINGQ